MDTALTRSEIRLLGRFSVRRDGREIPPAAFGGRLVRTLVRILVSRRGRLVSRDVLVEALWPERVPADPGTNLKVLVNRARRALGEPSPIQTLPGGYSFAEDDAWAVDAASFRAAVDDGLARLARGETGAGLRGLLGALERWGGEPLVEDAYSDWARGYRDELLRVHRQALEAASEAALSLGDVRRAVDLAQQAVTVDELSEQAHLLLVRALASGGDEAAALAAFAELRRCLRDELGVEPSAGALALEDRLRRGEDASPSVTTAAAPVGHRARRLGEGFDSLPFVGREEDMATVLAALAAPATSTVTVAGRSGAGKSRLLGEVVERVTVPALVVRAFLPERNEAWSLARSILREAFALDVEVAGAVAEPSFQALSDLVPEVGELRPVTHRTLDPESRRALTLEGATRVLEAATAGGAVLVVDDLQWADETSLALLGRVVSRVSGLDMLVAYRPEAVTSGSGVAGFLADLGGVASAVAVELGGLRADELGSIIPDEALVSAIADSGDGTPLALSEVLRTLAATEVLGRDAEGRWHAQAHDALDQARAAAIEGQRRSIAARAGAQDPRCQRLLSLLSLLGREVPAGLLAATTGATERAVLEDLEHLVAADLVRLGELGWAPAHDLIGDTITDGLNRGARGHLHQLLAGALLGGDADPAEIAGHLSSAGDHQAAADAYAAAGRASLDRFADDEAERLAHEGLRLEPHSPATRAGLLEIRAETSARRGDLGAAQARLRDALAVRPTGVDRSRLLTRLAVLSSGSQDLLRADELVELAIVEAHTDPGARATALAAGAIVDMNLERAARAEARAEEALALFERIGDAAGVGGILDGRAMAMFLQGRIRDGVDAFDRVAELFRDSGDLLSVVTPRSTRGHGLVFLGAPHAGVADCDTALEVARALGHPESQAYALWHRSEALTAAGSPGDGLASAQESLEIARRLGHRGWTATALRARGVAEQASGELERAEESFRASLDRSRNLPLFASWANARLGMVLIAAGRPGEARRYVDHALSDGPGLAHYEANLAHAELAAAVGSPDHIEIARDARRAAEAGGHLASLSRLAELAG